MAPVLNYFVLKPVFMRDKSKLKQKALGIIKIEYICFWDKTTKIMFNTI